MKNLLSISLLALLLASASAVAQPRYATLITRGSPAITNSVVAIQDFEIAELVRAPDDNNSFIKVTKDGKEYIAHWLFSNGTAKPLIVPGPASINFENTGSVPPNDFCVFTITPSNYTPPNQTLVLPPGTNGVNVVLECSVDLKNWSNATNGVYVTPDNAKFFRIRMDRVP